MPVRRPLLALLLAATACLAAAGEATIPVALIGGQNNHDWKLSNAFHMDLLRSHPGLAPVEANAPEKGADAAAWAAWKPEFAKYRCVLLNYNGQQWPEPVQREFEAYIRDGGSAIVLHAANNSFQGWGEYEKMVGLLWRDKSFGTSLHFDAAGTLVREAPGEGADMGHGGQYDWQMQVRDAAHPITAGMPKEWRHMHDELYHAQRGPAQDVNILLSAFSDARNGGTGRHEPIVWWVPYGKGKVVTNVMGHVGETACLSCVGYQVTVLRSIEWLAKGRCALPIPADFPTAQATSQDYPGGPPKSLKHDVPVAESLMRFTLPPGYRIELVAQEPMVINPVACSWDGDGRLLVAEMRTYMMDADGSRQDEPKSRVSMLVDADGDGVYEKATAYADNLVLPRMVLALGDRVVIAETYTGRFVSHRDSDGDGVSDQQQLVFDGGKAGGNLEHQDSALMWSLDNRLYTAQTGSRRFRIEADGTWGKEQLFGRGGQWGLALDDLGRSYGSTGGGESPAFGFQQHPAYGALSLDGELAPGFNEVFPALQSVDVQGGRSRVHPLKGTLNHITGCAGQSIYRGDRLPADLYGDYILPEPVGRLVRRAKIEVREGKRVLVNAHPGGEFITSTDPAFRPVWSATGPDGCLYLLDMHNGIVQESNWTRPGSYLRSIIDRDGHGKYNGRGRIYRIVADGMKPGPQPRMLGKKPAELIAHLSHANGWWRDTAQQLIVLAGDRSVVPALQQLARSGAAPLGRVHALWTLDGLGATDGALLTAAFADADERVRASALRIAEGLIAKGDSAILASAAKLAKDPAIDVQVQLVNSLRYAPDGAGKPVVTEIASRHVGNEIITASAQQSLQFDPKNPRGIKVQLDGRTMELVKKGQEHYAQLCIACHGADGKGMAASDGQRLAPPLSGSPRVLGSPELATRILLDGLVGEIDGKTYPGLMLPMKGNDDRWLAEVLTYVRNSFGNAAPAIHEDVVKRIRAATEDQAGPYTLADLAGWQSVPRQAMEQWVLSASHGAGNARKAIDGDSATRWDTGAGQTAGQWFQIDLGKPYALASLTLDTNASAEDYPRGYEVRTSADGTTWSEPVAKGTGDKAIMGIDLKAGTTARFVRIIQNASGKTGLYWSIHELTVFGKPQP